MGIEDSLDTRFILPKLGSQYYRAYRGNEPSFLTAASANFDRTKTYHGARLYPETGYDSKIPADLTRLSKKVDKIRRERVTATKRAFALFRLAPFENSSLQSFTGHLRVDTETVKLFSSVYKETERAARLQKRHPL